MPIRGPYTFKIQPVKKTRKFGGKVYRHYAYEPMRSAAKSIVRQLRNQGKAARMVAQPGYGQGGWNIYVRG